jgi:hypothetical protein
LVLLAVALVIPQLTWADHASDHPYSQFDDPALVSPSEGYAALVEKYMTRELVYHAPGRRDDNPSSMSPSEAYAADSARWVAQGTYYMEKSERAAAADSARWVAQGNYYKSERAAAADSARWAALGSHYTASNAVFLAENPEVMTYRRSVQDGCSELGQVC